MYYWNEKDKRAEKARIHTAEMARKYPDQIKRCVTRTVTYSDVNAYGLGGIATQTVIQDTTDGALFALHQKGEKIALLNFASYHNPGGKFIEGSSAQEESLCHSSFLYNVLSEKKEYYEWNNAHKNKGLYTNRALYTTDVVFELNRETRTADVLTCAAPNRSVMLQYGNFTEDENLKALKSRVEFVKNICVDRGVQVMILGAWGCGVFKQDPETVAELFKTAFANTGMDVIYAVPDQKTFNVFEKVFK